MDPIVGGSIIQGVANLLGGIFGLGSQQSANEQNMRIAQMNNAFNERMLEKQMQYNTQMWRAQNLYNSASQQRYRLEQAGLNPYMMMDGGNAGTASSASGITPPTATPVQVQPLDYGDAFSRLASTIGDYYQVKNLDAQTKQIQSITEGVDIENRFKAVQAFAEVYKLFSDADKNKAQTARQLIENDWLPKMFDIGARKGESEISLNASVEALNRVNEAKGQKELKWIDSQAAANIARTMSATYKDYKEAQKAVAETLESEARTRGVNISNETARAMAGHLVSKSFYESVQAEQQVESNEKTIRQQGADYWNPFRYLGNLLGPAASVFVGRGK